MGFRSQIKKGGGFLNNVDGTLVGYEFSRRFKDESKDGENLYFVPSIQLDGADDPVDQHIFIGKGERFDISKDGQELTMADESPVTIPYSLPFGRFMDSLFAAAEKAGVDIESELPDLEAGEALTLESLVDRRFRFKQEVDKEGTEKFGKRVSGSGKNKREFDRTNTVIDAILGETKGSGKASASEKSSGKGGKKGKGADLEEQATDAFRAMLKNGPVNVKNLSLAVSKALVKNDNKDELKPIMMSEEFRDKLEDAGVIETSKKGEISLADSDE